MKVEKVVLDVEYYGHTERCREDVKKVLKGLVQKCSKKIVVIIASIFLTITFSRLVAGAVKLKSDCPDEKRVAVYLFTKAILGFVFWVLMMVLGYKEALVKAVDNLFVEVLVIIDFAFSFVWLILGTVWTCGERDDMIKECPSHVPDWNQHFINFALVLTVIDLIGLVIFGISFCYFYCDKSEEAEAGVDQRELEVSLST